MEEGAIIKNDLDKAPKTGDWGFMEPQVDASKCIGCSSCVMPCPDAAIEMRKRISQEQKMSDERFKDKDIPDFDRDFCKGCGVCVAVCPVKAIVMKKK